LLGHGSIQSNSRLRELLLNEQWFEEALGTTQSDPFTQADHQAFERALLDAFVAMDKEIAHRDQSLNAVSALFHYQNPSFWLWQD
jgi:hypothetical protein